MSEAINKYPLGELPKPRRAGAAYIYRLVRRFVLVFFLFSFFSSWLFCFYFYIEPPISANNAPVECAFISKIVAGRRKSRAVQVRMREIANRSREQSQRRERERERERVSTSLFFAFGVYLLGCRSRSLTQNPSPTSSIPCRPTTKITRFTVWREILKSQT